jgi:hypothetical protein
LFAATLGVETAAATVDESRGPMRADMVSSRAASDN